MFCRYCGKDIDDDAIFCNHCGKNQNLNLNNNVVKSKLSPNIPLLIILVVWELANLILLLSETRYYAGKYFYPFTEYIDGWRHYYNFDARCYDGEEFFVYAIFFPLMIYCVYVIFQRLKKH